MPLVSQNPYPFIFRLWYIVLEKVHPAAQPHWPLLGSTYPQGVSVVDGKKRSCSNLKKMKLNISSSSTLRLRQQITTNKAEITANTDIGRSLKVLKQCFFILQWYHTCAATLKFQNDPTWRIIFGSFDMVCKSWWTFLEIITPAGSAASLSQSLMSTESRLRQGAGLSIMAHKGRLLLKGVP